MIWNEDGLWFGVRLHILLCFADDNDNNNNNSNNDTKRTGNAVKVRQEDRGSVILLGSIQRTVFAHSKEIESQMASAVAIERKLVL